jgi:tRNA(His) guanylyltransferase
MTTVRLETRMKDYERALQSVISEEGYIVLRLDGRSFSRLTQEEFACEKPFDSRFSDWMIESTKAVLGCGITALYAHTQSDEISILLSRVDSFYGHRTQKLLSVLASTASAAFSLAAQKFATFDARILVLPDAEEVANYFLWRERDSVKNALNNYMYWFLRQAGKSAEEVTEFLIGKSSKTKLALLKREYGIDFDAVPSWQKYGVGLYYEVRRRTGINRFTGEETLVERLELMTKRELPTSENYRAWIKELIAKRS